MSRGASQVQLQCVAAGRAVCKWWLGSADNGKGARQQRSKGAGEQGRAYARTGERESEQK